MEILESKQSIDYDSYDYKSAQYAYETLMGLKLYKPQKGASLLAIFLGVHTKLLRFKNDIDLILDAFFRKNEDILYFMYTHVVFDIYDNKSSDPVVLYFRDKFNKIPIDGILSEYLEPTPVPVELMSIMSPMNPAQCFGDDYMCKIGLWRRDENDKVSKSPIDIVDTCDWPSIGYTLAEIESMYLSAGIIDPVTGLVINEEKEE